jgi:hypothetical protein
MGDKDFWERMYESNRIEMLTLIKGTRGQTEQKNRERKLIRVYDCTI